MRKQRILLVEDSLTQALRLEDMFDRAGFAVSIASSAAHALDELNRSLPDLMILDYHLPDMRGDELCRQIRLNVGTFSMPIIVLTADESPAAQQAGLESGADDFLPKSAQDSMILLRVRNQLRHTDRDPDSSMALPRAAFRKAEVLVVGAPAERAEDLDQVLREEGCRVEHVPDAASAMRRAPERAFDCIIVAERLTDGDGMDTSLELQSVAVGGPALLLLLRGAESASRIRTALELGLDDCIEPQPDYAVLRARLRATLRRRFLAEQNRRILDDYLSRERESLQLRAERAEAEARAALADELREANDRLQEAYARLEHQAAVTRTITESVSTALFMVDQDGLPTFMNPAAETLLGCGLERLQGKPLAESIGLSENGIAALRDGQAELFRVDGTKVPVIMSVAHLRQGGMVVQMVDVTERRRAEQRQAILMAELSHRVKNTLATVNSIAAQTRQRHQQDTDAFWAAFSGRLQALSNTHNLLARHHWGEVELAQLLTSEAAPYRDEQRGNLRLDGPPVQLSPKAALALGMAVHELATNAAKYGAFSTPEGRVDLSWTIDAAAEEGKERLLITWRETGGPPVSPPSRSGFGSRLIRSGLAYELGGSTKQDFRPEGLRVTMNVPLSEHVRLADPESAAPAA
ncbi:response regulator [Indioceanicola profundi]|uniref:response regulator n=1 Tax=Indioceanicola profundi TaxID=2220096 RepID=UPI000E6AA2DF|nr:response regulator [Indioceanicola profundi]